MTLSHLTMEFGVRTFPLWLLLLVSCQKVGSEDSDTDPVGDTDDTDVVGPCADGGWGTLTPRTDALFVSPAGSPTGAGTLADPLDTVDGALAALAGSGASAIVIGAGTYTTPTLELLSSSFDGVTLQGCGSDQVTLVASDDADEIVHVRTAQDVSLSGLTLSGGSRSLYVTSGATVVATDVVVDHAASVGILVSYAASLTLSAFAVQDTTPSELQPDVGYGIVTVNAGLDASDGRVEGSTGIGVLLQGDFSEASAGFLADVDVSSTLSASTGLGRGVQAQRQFTGLMIDCNILDSGDTGIYVLQPLHTEGVASFSIERTLVQTVRAGAAGDADTGDGIVISGNDDGTLTYEPSLFFTELTDNVVDGWQPDRAGILFDRADGASSNTLDAAGAAVLAFTQDSAVHSGSDTVDALAESLDVVRAPIVFDGG